MIWLAITLLAFVLGIVAQRRVQSPLANPTLLATLLVAAALLLSRTSYEQYRQNVEHLSVLLTPAVVALAAPLYRLRTLLAKQWRALVLGGLTGTLLGAGTDIGLPRLLRLGELSQRSLMTAPATSPVALQLAQFTHAPPTLAATLAVISGLIGALIIPSLLNLLGVTHPLARGIALGSVSHGIGTARAREESELTGAASSIGMGLAALIVTVIVAALG